MAIIKGPFDIRDDELNSMQDPELPSPLGLDFNNPQVQKALANININPYEQGIAPDPGQEAIKRVLATASRPVSNIPAPVPVQEESKAPEAKSIDFTGQPGDKSYSEELKDAQNKRNFNNSLERMVMASEKIGKAIAGGNAAQFKPDYSMSEAAIRDNDKYITDLQERKKAEGTDSNSGYSKGLRDWAKQSYGIDLKGASAEQVEKIAPYLSKQYEAEQERQNKKSLLEEKNKERQYEASERSKDRGIKLAEMAQSAQDRQDAKNAARYDTDFRRLGEKLTEETASSRSVLGKAANISRSADAINALASQIPDPNDLDTRQIQEIARNLDAMLSSGASTISGTEKLVPHTASGDSAKIAEYIAGIPKGANQAEFVHRMVDTVNREKALAQKQIGVAKTKITSGYGHLEKADSERYHGILKAHGIDNTDEDSYSDAQEKGIQRVMNDNKVSREQAVKALKNAGKL